MAQIRVNHDEDNTLIDTERELNDNRPERLFTIGSTVGMFLTRAECLQWAEVLSNAGNEMLAEWELELLNGKD